MTEKTKPVGFDAVIEALTIFRKYGNPSYPFCCEHDTLHVMMMYDDVTDEADRDRLEEIGFRKSEDLGSWQSTRYGSA